MYCRYIDQRNKIPFKPPLLVRLKSFPTVGHHIRIFYILLFERVVFWNHVENLPGRVYAPRKAHIVLGGELVSMSTLILSFSVCRVDSFSQLHHFRLTLNLLPIAEYGVSATTLGVVEAG